MGPHWQVRETRTDSQSPVAFLASDDAGYHLGGSNYLLMADSPRFRSSRRYREIEGGHHE
jgi:hypothetical protein